MIDVRTGEEVAADYRGYHVWLHDQLLLTRACNSEGDLVYGGISVTHGFAMGAVEEACQIVLDDIEADEETTIRSQGFDGRVMFAKAVRDLAEPETKIGGLQYPVEVGV